MKSDGVDPGPIRGRTLRPVGEIIVILRHVVRSGMAHLAERRIDANGERMAGMPGFLFRHTLISPGDTRLCVTATGWLSREHYDAWLDYQRVASAAVDAPSQAETPYVSVETEILDVRRSIIGAVR